MADIQVENLCRTYRTGGREVRALDRVSFEVPSGSFVAVVGYSGCGKTTLFRHIAGLEEPDNGATIFSNGNGGAEHVRPRLGMVFQEPRLLPWLTVTDNLSLALKRSGSLDTGASVREALEIVGLGEFGSAYPDQLSGGMAQRAALGRALCRRPSLLLMDEPFGALDALTRAQLQCEMARIWADRPMTVLFITHDIAEAVTLADRTLIMSSGRIIDDRPISLGRPRSPGNPEFESLRRGILATILAKTHKCKECEEQDA